MGLWGMIVMVAFFGCLTSILKSYFNAKAQAKDQQGFAHCTQRIEALEQQCKGNIERRLANLEELMTDREFDFDRRLGRDPLSPHNEPL